MIGVVKKRYRVVQNSEAPLFLDSIVDFGEASFVTAGSLHGGAQVWWLARLPEGTSVAGEASESVTTYLVLTNSHDGSTGIVVSVVPIRDVCQNTLCYALPSAVRTSKVKHTDSTRNPPEQGRKALELGSGYMAELVEIADRMLNTTISDEQFERFIDRLVPTARPVIRTNRVANQRGITMAESTKRLITGIYHNNPSQTGIVGTLWGAIQAAQYYSDHLTINRTTEDASPNENRFKRLTSGNTLGSRAFGQACAAALRRTESNRSPRRETGGPATTPDNRRSAHEARALALGWLMLDQEDGEITRALYKVYAYFREHFLRERGLMDTTATTPTPR